MNNKTILIEHRIADTELPITFGFERMVLREPTIEVLFTCTMFINGAIQHRRTFAAQYRDSDLDKPERLAAKIIEQVKYPQDIEIWDCEPNIVGEEWEYEIQMGDSTKELFAFLTNHKQKLMEVFI